MRRLIALTLALAGAPALGDVTPPPQASPGAARDGFQVGAIAKIVDAGQVFPSINQTDCLHSWPSDAVKAVAGESYWSSVGWQPRNGDVGVVIGRASHCFEPEVRLLILRVGARYVVVGSTGLALARPLAR